MKSSVELLDASQICAKFVKLIKECDEFYMMVAWATHNSPAYRALIKNVDKIKKAVIGLDFSQTSPEFIWKFSKSNAHVRFFVTKGKGVCHPKVYVFKDNKKNRSYIFIGSSNFTQGGFGANYECSIYFKEDSGGEITKTIVDKINRLFYMSRRLCSSEIKEYEKSFEKNTRNKYLSNEIVFKENGFFLTWRQFKELAERNVNHDAEYCKNVLEKGKVFLKKGFNKLSIREKGCFVGKYKSCENDKIDWHCFGDMRRVLPVSFKKWSCISRALAQIPTSDKVVQRKHYDGFFKELQKEVDIEKGLSFASRLLCLKRPDFFVCVTKRNKKKLKELFNMKLDSREDYWNFIEEVHVAKWYREAPKKDELYPYRMAILDAITYDIG